jgi:hypothetical protein
MSNAADSALYDFDITALKSQDRLRDECRQLTERLLVRSNALGGGKALAEETVTGERKKSLFGTLQRGKEERGASGGVKGLSVPASSEAQRLLVLNEDVFQACVTALDNLKGFVVREGRE